MTNSKLNCVIVHGCPSKEEDLIDIRRMDAKHWIPWLREELNSRGIKTETPLMPEPWKPVFETWKKEFEKYRVNENTILVGHSCGCAFLVRWLGESKQKIKKLILVAPWKIPSNDEKFRKVFYTYDIDKTIKSRVGEIVMFTSDDEEKEGKESLEIYHGALGGNIVELKGRGHFIMDHMGTNEFPELLKEIMS